MSKKAILATFLCTSLLFSMGTISFAAEASSEPQTEEQTTNDDGIYDIGEVWTVDGQWSLVVTSVDETDDRNEFAETDPAAVYIVSYAYKNIGYEDESGMMDGLFISPDEKVVDSTGKMGYAYPGEITYYANEAPVGALCEAQVCIGVDNPGNFQLMVDIFDGNFEEQQATFNIDLSAEAADSSVLDAPSESASADYQMGDTWTVDGQWELTIESVEETDQRNEFEEKDPAAVYIVTYTYKNLGYEDASGMMNGLFLSLDDRIVDSAGKMGYSYPADVSYYPEEVPVGAYCEAQVCIGVDNAGDFKLGCTMYDGNEQKQSAMFDVKVE